VDPPQEVVRQLLGRGLFERHHVTALGVHRTQEVSDRSVLAARVERLETDQQRPPPFGVEELLQFSQPLAVAFGLLGRPLVAVMIAGRTRVDVFEFDGCPRTHSEAFHVVHFTPTPGTPNHPPS
jgi:hypothetical protein